MQVANWSQKTVYGQVKCKKKKKPKIQGFIYYFDLQNI
jgi:hypothetical protein